MKHPKVSVIVPSYNHRAFLAQRLDSILNQTFRDFEVFILDDASSDGSHSVLARYYGKPRVRIIVNSQNSGSAFRQWDHGICLARGEYVWIAESDDCADPRFLEVLVPLLDSDASLGLAYCQSCLINKQGEVVGNSLNWTQDLDTDRWKSDYRNIGIDELRQYLIVKNTIPNASAVLSRRTFLLQTRPIDASFRLCGDWLHWGKMLLLSNIAYVAQALNYWRLGSSNSRHAISGVLEWEEGARVLAYFTRALECTEAESAGLIIRFGSRCLEWALSSTSVRNDG
jgi:glycosyltransferase involved in cell wall biosynthesis